VWVEAVAEEATSVLKAMRSTATRAMEKVYNFKVYI
jgi:hypothetical protein